MLANPKRLFLRAKITITDRRNRLGNDTIQALACLKSWLELVQADNDSLEDEYEVITTLRANREDNVKVKADLST
jgi:hypothetical protein